MKFSLNFLNNYVKVDLSAKELADLLTMHFTETKIVKYKKDGDAILDVDLQPNRADCYCYLGLAREISVLTGQELRVPESNIRTLASGQRQPSFRVAAKISCLRYSARYIGHIRVMQSPRWLQRRLKRSGLAVNNNVIDILHYVMLEYGQPMHAFDAAKVVGVIKIKRATKPSKFVGLDGKRYPIQKGMLLICDAKRILAIAGVLGGLDSCVTNQTKEIILESASFSPGIVRETAKKLGVNNESTIRFEKKLDPQMTLVALDRAAYLIQKLISGALVGEIKDVRNFDPKETKISLRYSKLNSWLNYEIDPQELKMIFESLEFQVSLDKELISVVVPSFRTDVNSDVDLIEEVARIKGLDLIPIRLPKPGKSSRINKKYYYRHLVTELLPSSGFNEIYSSSFIGAKTISQFGKNKQHYVEVTNPLSPDKQYLRHSIEDNLMQIISSNAKYRKRFKIFEINKVYQRKSADYKEYFQLALFWVDKNQPSQQIFLKMKFLLGKVAEIFGVNQFTYQISRSKTGYRYPKRSFRIMLTGELIGRLYQLNPSILSKFNLNLPVFEIKLNFDRLTRLAPAPQKGLSFELPAMTPARAKKAVFLSKYPAILRDLNFLIPEKQVRPSINSTIAKIDPLITEVKLLDRYEGDLKTKGFVSLTYHLVFQAKDRTLTKTEVNSIMKKIMLKLNKKYQAKSRF